MNKKDIPLSEVKNVDKSVFVLQKEGKGKFTYLCLFNNTICVGRIYYDINLQIAPTTFSMGAENNGFSVER